MKPARPFWKKARLVLLFLLIIGIAIQFIRPRLDNPPVTGDLQAPEEVKAILQRACYDCHSNQTKLAWFDLPAPAYWLVVDDVKEGRAVLNFSEISNLPKGQQAAKLFESIFQVEQNAMPLKQYTALHHGGKITPEEIATLKKFALTLAYHPKPDTAKQRYLLDQYEKWMKAATAAADIKPEHNGIGYADLAGFSNWKAVSTTERYDNGTLRLILGNDVVVKAVHEGHTNPWPDGAVFAKVAWDQVPDSSGSGEIHAGGFRQVEFMIRDAKKYDTSFGWGFARWVGGLAMKPYGKDASFVSECMNCHKPMGYNNYTFTIPVADTIGLYDQAVAAVSEPLASHPLTGRIITTIVNTRDSTMSTLYGNDIAVKSARAGQAYPAGAVVSLVTWSQRDDPHWFGGRIPKALHSIEMVSYDPAAVPSYVCYEGATPAKKTVTPEEMQARVKYITVQKASVIP
jgi:hypothetical protein